MKKLKYGVPFIALLIVMATKPDTLKKTNISRGVAGTATVAAKIATKIITEKGVTSNDQKNNAVIFINEKISKVEKRQEKNKKRQLSLSKEALKLGQTRKSLRRIKAIKKENGDLAKESKSIKSELRSLKVQFSLNTDQQVSISAIKARQEINLQNSVSFSNLIVEQIDKIRDSIEAKNEITICQSRNDLIQIKADIAELLETNKKIEEEKAEIAEEKKEKKEKREKTIKFVQTMYKMRNLFAGMYSNVQESYTRVQYTKSYADPFAGFISQPSNLGILDILAFQNQRRLAQIPINFAGIDNLFASANDIPLGLTIPPFEVSRSEVVSNSTTETLVKNVK